MSNSEDSYDDEDYVPISTRFGSLIYPRLDTEHVNALQESVRKQKVEENKINKEGSELSVLQGKNSKTDQKDNDDESLLMEKDEKMTSSNKIQDTDQLEEKMEVVGALGETDNLLKSDVTQEYDKIETTEKVANKEGNDSAQLKDNKNTKEQAETDDILIIHETQVDEKIQTPEELEKRKK
jgi:hypothetical protein